jgi:hypothetical protein
MAAGWAGAASFDQLVREHRALVAAAMAEHLRALLDKSGLSAEVLAQVRSSPEWPQLLRMLGEVEDRGLDVAAFFSRLSGPQPTRTDDDVAALLETGLARLEQVAGAYPSLRQEWVAGLVRRAHGIADEDMARGAREREDAIAGRARHLAEAAVRAGAAWARPFGTPPVHPVAADAWWDRLGVIAAYRDRWRVAGAGILGDTDVGSLEQAAHRARARRAGQEAARLSGLVAPVTVTSSASMSLGPEPGVDL